ncbi:hypothetical protein, partial [Achromobacter xylosoxidans]|uniref:hypothetical protein n=1 Tax=Alcaligenes xylosoxydans xylosoxydans TaxID=85698 RepID=UPI001C5300D3
LLKSGTAKFCTTYCILPPTSRFAAFATSLCQQQRNEIMKEFLAFVKSLSLLFEFFQPAISAMIWQPTA